MKKIFFLLAGLPKNIHAVNSYVQRAYEAWNGIYAFLHPNGPPVDVPATAPLLAGDTEFVSTPAAPAPVVL